MASMPGVIRSLLVIVTALTAPVQAASSFLSISASPNPATFGDRVTLTATVTPGTATGRVSFYQGPDLVGVASIVAGQAILTTSSLACGTQPLKAYYAGDASFSTSSSAEISMAVKSVLAQGFHAVLTQKDTVFSSFASGDFNGDGKTDLVVVSQGGTSTVYFGNGDGTFHKGPVTQGISYYPGPILLVADFNGDGKADFALGGSGLSLLFGNGDGTFQPAVNYPLTGEHAVAGDFNGDGILDIATGNGVLLGHGDGTFAVSALAAYDSVMAAADLNHDGITDLLVRTASGDVAVYMGNGDGHFVDASPHLAFSNLVNAIATGDFFGRGGVDLAVASYSAVSLFPGNGDGTFGAPRSFPFANYSGLLVTDTDGDGNLDLVATGGSGAVVLQGDGTGALNLNAFQSGRYVGLPPVNDIFGTAAVIGDFNADGRVDIVTFRGGDYIHAYLGVMPTDLTATLSHDGNFHQGQTGFFTSVVTNLGPGDIAGTVTLAISVPQLFTPVYGSGKGWYCGVTDPFCSRSDSLPVGSSYPPVTFAATVSASAPALMNATATVSIDTMSDPNPANDSAVDTVATTQSQSIVFGTLPDLLVGAPPFALTAVASSGLPVSYTASGNCSVAGAVVTITASGSCTIVAGQPGNSIYLPAPDISRTFIIGASATTVSLSVAPASSMVGTPVTLTATVSPDVAQGRIVFYDGTKMLGSANLAQGKATLVMQPTDTGRRQLYARYVANLPWPGGTSATVLLTVNAAPSFQFNAVSLPGKDYAVGVAVGDVNGDGIPDIIAASTVQIIVYLGDGTGKFGAPIYTAFHGSAITLGDFNGDGKLDLALGGSSTVRIALGRGDGTFTAGPVLAIPADSIVAADFNGDGLTDLAIGHGPIPGVSILLNRGDGTFDAAIEYAVSGDRTDTWSVVLAAADLNRDGVVDLVAVTGVAYSASSAGVNNRVNVLIGRGDGTFLQPAGWVDDQVLAGEGPTTDAIAVGDLNGDGIPDLAIQSDSVNSGGNPLSVLLGNGDGTFQPPAHYLCSGGSPGGLLIGDFTGDGRVDIAAVYSGSYGSGGGALVVFPGNGDGTFRGSYNYGNYPASFSSPLAAADFNGDGRLDLAVGNYYSLAVLEGVAGPAFRVDTTYSVTPSPNPKMTTNITIGNAGSSTTSGEITVSYNVPPYPNQYPPNVLSMTGEGWGSSLITRTYTTAAALAGAGSLPPLTLTTDSYNVSGTFTSINNIRVYGGGWVGYSYQLFDQAIIHGDTRPVITSVNTAGSTSSLSTVSPNDWIEIHGYNLVPANTPAAGVNWNKAPEFATGRMPTQLADFTVTVNGNPAYIYFYCSAATSPTCTADQINVLTPLDTLTRVVSIEVRTSTGYDAWFSLPNPKTVSPSFLRFAGSQYVTATHADYSLLGPASLYPGSSTPAKPGEVVLLWGVGFGLPTTPLTAGSSKQTGVMPAVPVCTVGGYLANVSINLVSPGLYQLNLTVPAQSRSGDNPLTCIYQGEATSDGVLLSVR